MSETNYSIESSNGTTPQGWTTKTSRRPKEQQVIVPAADIFEENRAAVIVLDIPGASEHSIEINVERGTLAVTASIEEMPTKGYRLRHAEYRVGNYERRFSIGETVDTTKIAANFRDGVLRITLPYREELTPKKIQVRAA